MDIYYQTIENKYNVSNRDTLESSIHNLLEEISPHSQEISIDLTGNPLVDNGLIAIAVKSEKDARNVTLQDLISIFKTGKELASVNHILKNITRVFTSNYPLNSPQFGSTKSNDILMKKESETIPSIKQEFIFRMLMTEYLRFISYEKDEKNFHNACLICGKGTNIHLGLIYKQIKTYFPEKKKSNKVEIPTRGATRNLFPLLGSIGSEAQIFPAMSETFIVCPKCLFVVNYVPMAVSNFGNYLLAYQSSNLNLIQSLIKDNVDNIEEKFGASGTNQKIEAYEKKDKLKVFDSLLNALNHSYNPKNPTTLNYWLFNNSGTGADNDLIEFPNQALKWLYITTNSDFKSIVRECIKNEEKLIAYSKNRLINSISHLKDYPLLYIDNNKFPLPSIEFYDFYQQSIRNWSSNELNSAKKIAKRIRDELKPETIERLLIKKERINLLSKIYNSTINLIFEGELNVNEAKDLFFKVPNSLLENFNQFPNAIDLFKYYLKGKADLSKGNLEINQNLTFKTNNKALNYLKMVNFISSEIGKYEKRLEYSDSTKFKNFILNDIMRLKISWFNQVFYKISSNNIGFDLKTYNWVKRKGLIESFPSRTREIDFLFLIQLNLIERSNGENPFIQQEYTLSKLIENSELTEDFVTKLQVYLTNSLSKNLDINHKKLLNLISSLQSHRITERSIFRWISEYLEDSNYKMTQEVWESNGIDSFGKYRWSILKQKLILFLLQYRQLGVNIVTTDSNTFEEKLVEDFDLEEESDENETEIELETLDDLQDEESINDNNDNNDNNEDNEDNEDNEIEDDSSNSDTEF